MHDRSRIPDHPVFRCLEHRYLVGTGSTFNRRRVALVLIAHFKMGAIEETRRLKLAREIAKLTTIDDIRIRHGLLRLACAVDLKVQLKCSEHDARLMQEFVFTSVLNSIQAIKEPAPGQLLFYS